MRAGKIAIRARALSPLSTVAGSGVWVRLPYTRTRLPYPARRLPAPRPPALTLYLGRRSLDAEGRRGGHGSFKGEGERSGVGVSIDVGNVGRERLLLFVVGATGVILLSLDRWG